MKTSMSEWKHEIKWTCWTQLDDLDFENDLALQSHTHGQIQVKTNNVAAATVSVGLNIHKGKSNIVKYNTENSNPITLDGEALEELESSTYLESIIDEQGRSDAEVNARNGKARAASIQLINIWNLKQLSTNTKIRISNTNVKTVTLY
ncbi:Laminin subunit gamma-1 [Schistosoma haematobium]|uniref:Laminin subunit gamma-1 n=1 Tax=Schistosoma haematobium TaxID=6185 RepID=A0A922LW59_SCHHA|nr:Laminin subunit gamma-1 [Schistosoma haematobium]KAH9595244.1 Laminin subunit gamma-1 [Schistosoma haematobium]